MVKQSKPKSSQVIFFEQQVFKELEKKVQENSKALEFVSKHKVRIRFSPQKNSGARWTFLKNISLNSKSYSISTTPDDPGLQSLVLHEIHHLQQGPLTALSVYGELDAWQVGFRFYQQHTGRPLREPLQKLLDIQLSWSRQNLIYAKKLMKEYSPGYRIDWLPLYPIHHEIVWQLTHRNPEGLKDQTTDQR